MSIPIACWNWYGTAAHFICGEWCRFHMTTEVGPYLVSTVGRLVHPHDGGASEATDRAYRRKHPNGQSISGDGLCYETMVFRHTGRHCDDPSCICGGLPIVEDWSELSCVCTATASLARTAHMKACLDYALKASL